MFATILVWLLSSWYNYVLPSVNCKLYAYLFLMLMRPILIVVGFFTDFNQNILVSLVWFVDTGLYFLFYFLIFKMKVIQIVMEHNIQLKKEYDYGGKDKKDNEYEKMMANQL